MFIWMFYKSKHNPKYPKTYFGCILYYTQFYHKKIHRNWEQFKIVQSFTWCGVKSSPKTFEEKNMKLEISLGFVFEISRSRKPQSNRRRRAESLRAPSTASLTRFLLDFGPFWVNFDPSVAFVNCCFGLLGFMFFFLGFFFAFVPFY